MPLGEGHDFACLGFRDRLVATGFQGQGLMAAGPLELQSVLSYLRRLVYMRSTLFERRDCPA